MEAEDLKPLYPELLESLDAKEFETVVKIEKGRYDKSRENAKQIVNNIISKGKETNKKHVRHENRFYSRHDYSCTYSPYKSANCLVSAEYRFAIQLLVEV